jgi:acyl-CoA synthetase (AMP-forming)/AMP-acid ligase II
MMQDPASGASWRELLGARRALDKPWLILPKAPHRSDECRTISYRELYAAACRVASASTHLANGRPIRVVIICDSSSECCVCIFGALLAGLTFVPAAPNTLGRPDMAWKRQFQKLLDECAPALVLGPASEIRKLEAGPGVVTATFEAVLDREVDAGWEPTAVDSSTVALGQFTSGTTGNARAVELSHANLLCNIASIGQRTEASERDVVASWLPLFHDMGLIGSLLFSAYWGMSLVLMPPRAFVARPEAWLWAISRFGVTLSPAPNAAYEICASKVTDAKVARLDLSRWRVAFNGAELVHLATVERFCGRFGKYGFCARAMYPVYGLAEHTVAATLPLGRPGAQADWIDGQTLDAYGHATAVEPRSAGARAVIALGAPLPGHNLRIVDAHDNAVAGERLVGEIQLNGPSRMIGYRGDSTGRAFSQGGWLRTGDRGYVADGNLYVVGRSKDVINRGGRNIDAALIEGAVRAVESVRGGVVAAFGVADSVSGTERLVVLAETSSLTESEKQTVRRRIALAVGEAVALAPDVIELVQAGTIPRTTSGKVKHSQARQNYLGGVG